MPPYTCCYVDLFRKPIKCYRTLRVESKICSSTIALVKSFTVLALVKICTLYSDSKLFPCFSLVSIGVCMCVKSSDVL